MQLFLKVAIFALVNLIAFFTMPILVVLPVKFGFFPELSDELVQRFRMVYGAGGMLGWSASALISLGYIFTQTKKRFIFLATPICFSVLYVTGVLIYFTIIA